MKLVTADQMRELEQHADQAGNTYAMMMERAGKAVADAIIERWGAQDKRVLVLVGPGNNGGDGLVCARYLHDAGAHVSLYLWKREPRDDDENYRLCVERKISTTRAEEDNEFVELRKRINECDVVVDALLGTGVTRPIEGLLKELLSVVRSRISKQPTSALAPLLPLSHSPTRPAVVAVDLPSGLDPDTGALDPAALNADLTVTFAFPKTGQLAFPGANAVGELVIADIGIREEWADANLPNVATAREIAALLPARPRDSHKGTFGKAMLCVGSANYVGAAFLAGSAAARAGAGLVTLALARTIYPMVASVLHETTFVVLPDDLGALVPDAVGVLREHLTDYDALLIGCGFGRDAKTIEFVHKLLNVIASREAAKQHLHRTWLWLTVQKHRTASSATVMQVSPTSPLGIASAQSFDSAIKNVAPLRTHLAITLPPLVIDADALFALAQSGAWWTNLKPNSAILTPHPGEMATLTGLSRNEVQADRINVAKKFAVQWNQVVVLKGAFTVVASPDERVTILPFATPALATAGTGDVLAGTIVAMLAQLRAMNRTANPYDAAIAGAYLHGLAGEMAEKEIGKAGVVAGDLIPRLPKAFGLLES